MVLYEHTVCLFIIIMIGISIIIIIIITISREYHVPSHYDNHHAIPTLNLVMQAESNGEDDADDDDSTYILDEDDRHLLQLLCEEKTERHPVR